MPTADFDPEDDALSHPGDEESGSEDDLKDDKGREHYESVGKSSLRRPDQPVLDAKYGGVTISRSALDNEADHNDPFAPVEEDEEDDPFSARNGKDSTSDEGSELPSDVEPGSEVDEDEEIESDEALGESDVERFKSFKFRGSRHNRSAQNTEEGDESSKDLEVEGLTGSDDLSTDDSDIEMDGDEEGEDASSNSASSPPPRLQKSGRNADREELKKLAFSSASTAGLASALSAEANADVKKGQAVKQQRQIFDRLLDARIKLQKGIAAMNELPAETIDDDEVKNAAKQAEDAALALWSTIDSIRCTILSSQDGPSSTKTDSSPLKRKRLFTPTRSTSISEIWAQTTSLDSSIIPVRRSTLEKWQTKTQPILDTAPRSKLLGPSQPTHSRLTDVLDTYLATESSKLVTNSTPSPQTYDDGPFYQSLLRDLIASRAANSSTDPTAAGIPILPTKLHPSGSRNKKVDTKASKGRKVRYTVHEKLENFMAPEDRSTWSEAARTEFFASLFGRVGALEEGQEVDGRADGDGEDEEVNGEMDALRLFRS